MNSDGQYLYTYYTRGALDMDYKDYVWVEFGGALGAVLFCVSVATGKVGRVYA